MNENFIAKWKESQLSISDLSRQTGLAYSLIYNIVHQKKDINQRTAADVTRIAAVLGTTPDQIMNPFCMVDGYHGKYRGIPFDVTADPKPIIHFCYNDTEVSIAVAYDYNLPQRFSHYIHFIELSIDQYIEEQAAQQHLKEVLDARRQAKSRIHSNA